MIGRVSWAFKDDYVHIFDLYVPLKNRRKGHAKALLREAIGQIRATGYRGSISIVAIPTEGSIPLEKLKAFYS